MSGYSSVVTGDGAQDDLAQAHAVVLREQVLNPIGMKWTTLSLDDVTAEEDYASPHSGDILGTLHALPLLIDHTAIAPVAPLRAVVERSRNGGLGPDRTQARHQP